MKSRKGFTLVEIIISVLILGAIGIGLVDFSSQFFNAANVHTQQLEKINFIRSTVERVSDEIRKAEYVYPSDVAISLTGEKSININTSDAIGLLIPIDKENLNYRFTAFYINNGNLMEFHSDSTHNWEENTVPAEILISFSGSSQSIASDIESENAQLNYNLDYNNGITDSLLKGEIAAVSVNSTKALIKSIKWNMTINKGNSEEIVINGVSNNVPRFVE